MICFLSPCSRVPATSAGWHGIQLFAVRRSRTPQPKTNHPRKMGLAVNHLGRASIVLVPVLDHEIVERKIVAIAIEIETEKEIVIGIEIVIAIVIVDVDQDQEIGETAIETEIIVTEIGIVGIEIEIEIEEENDLSHQLHFLEQDYHLEKVSVPLA